MPSYATGDERIGWLGMQDWSGLSWTKVSVIGETATRYQIRALDPTRLAGRWRVLYPGGTAFVPKTAIRFAGVKYGD